MDAKHLIALSCVASALCGLADTPYVINVPPATTNELSETDLEALGSGAYDVLIKEGAGTLHATSALESFAGEIRITNGVWLVTDNGTGFFGTSAGATYVTAGAAIHVKAPAPENKCKFSGENFYMEGNGPDGKGVLYNESGCDETQLFGSYGSVTLTGDATFSSRYRIDFCYYGYLRLNGHNLTYRSYDTGGVRTFGLTTSPFSLGAGETLTVNHAYFSLDVNSVTTAFEVEEGAKLVLTNSASMAFRNNVPLNQDVKPLDLTLANATMYTELSNVSQPYAGNWGTNANSYAGPVKLLQNVFVSGVGNGTPLTFGGPVSGSGQLTVSKARLQLANANNTYTGSIVVDGTGADIEKCGFRLWRGANMPPVQSFTVRNAQFVLSDNEAVTIPAITVEGAAQVIGGPATNPAVRSVAASLVKTGDGELYWDSSLDVTGVASIEGGVLRLAKPKLGNPGLGEGRNQCQNSVPFNYYYNNGSGSWNQSALQYCSTIRREGLAGAFSRAEWRYYTCLYYHGYVWNRTSENVTWDLASVLGTYAYLYIDGQRIDGVSSGAGRASAQGGHRSQPIVLTPGAHELAFYYVDQKSRADAQFKSIPGPTIGWFTEWWPWVDRAVAYDPEGTIGSVCEDSSVLTKDYIKAHFIPFRDPGDGSLFTVDNKTTEEIDQRGYHPGFSNLVVKAGAAIDLNGNDLAVGRIGMGTGVISNGTLTVKGGFSFSTTTPGEGPTVKGPVVIADGATVDIDETTKVRNCSYVLLTAEGGITGTISVDGELHPNWVVRKNGNRLELAREQGMFILFR